MKRACNLALNPNAVIAAGLVLFAVAWLIPVHKYGHTLPEGIPGWEAFIAALSPLWAKPEALSAYDAALSAASAATNFFVLALLVAWPWRVGKVVRLLGWACLFSLPLNAKWVLSNLRPDLRLGYFAWWLSFGVLAFAIWLRVRAPRQQQVEGDPKP